MRIQDVAVLLGQPGRTNYFLVCSDSLGFNLLMDRFLQKLAGKEDIHYFTADSITVEKARQIEEESRLAPRTGAELSHFVIYRAQRIPTFSVGPILKAVEEAKFARFIFQAQYIPQKIRTLMSRSSVVYLPFLSRAAVRKNLQSWNKDTKAVDELGLYDGTLAGTIDSLGMKHKLTDLRRDLKQGSRGLSSILRDLMVDSEAFTRAIQDYLTHEERNFLERSRDYNLRDRRKMVLIAAMLRCQT